MQYLYQEMSYVHTINRNRGLHNRQLATHRVKAAQKVLKPDSMGGGQVLWVIVAAKAPAA